MAGWSAYSKLDTLILVPIQAIGMASTTFVGQNHGAKNMKRLVGHKAGAAVSLAITALICALVMLLSRTLLTLFTRDADVLAYGQRFTLIISPF
jgi:Na+-driven multidrug efflux pump